MNPTIQTAFWSDADVEAAEPSIKLTVLWLITNPQTSMIGLCKVTPRRFTFETGLDATWLTKACAALPRMLLQTSEGIWLRNFIGHQFGRGKKLQRNNCFRAVRSAFAGVKDADLRSAVLETYPEFGQSDEIPSSTSPVKGLVRGRVEKSREEKSPEGGQGETNQPPVPAVEVADPDRELSADEIVEGVKRIFKTPRSVSAESLHRVSESMPVKTSELAELERFYAAPPEPDNPAMARCQTPKNLCCQLGDQLVKARAYCSSRNGRKNGSNGAHKPFAPPDEITAFIDAHPEYAKKRGEWTALEQLPDFARGEFSRWRKRREPIAA